jgi:hypothetical protein
MTFLVMLAVLFRESYEYALEVVCFHAHDKLNLVLIVVFLAFQLQVFDANKDGRLQLSEMAK